jgi:DNA-binding transcriptional regulator YhcF (GntR family)
MNGGDMKYNFTDGTRMALALAREEAIRLGHPYLGTEHMLLGLLREARGTEEILRALDLSGEAIRERVDGAVRKGAETPGLAEMPYTSRAKKVLEFAMAEARELRDDYVGVEHLFLGLLREEKGIAAQVLVSLGAGLEQARIAVLHLRSGQPQESAFRMEIDDAADVSIYEQIVARVQEAVATGELVPGSRLPPVRRLADQLDIAPGTVARAYSELESLGVVVTEGARGTRVAARAKRARPELSDPETLVGLLRPVAVAAFHMGVGADELRAALDAAMEGIF